MEARNQKKEGKQEIDEMKDGRSELLLLLRNIMQR